MNKINNKMQQSAPNMYENDKNDSYAFIHQFIPFLNCLSNQFQWTDTSWCWVRVGCTQSITEQKQNAVSGQNWRKPTQVMWPQFSFSGDFFWKSLKPFFKKTYSLTVFQWIQI